MFITLWHTHTHTHTHTHARARRARAFNFNFFVPTISLTPNSQFIFVLAGVVKHSLIQSYLWERYPYTEDSIVRNSATGVIGDSSVKINVTKAVGLQIHKILGSLTWADATLKKVLDQTLGATKSVKMDDSRSIMQESSNTGQGRGVEWFGGCVFLLLLLLCLCHYAVI